MSRWRDSGPFDMDFLEIADYSLWHSYTWYDCIAIAHFSIVTSLSKSLVCCTLNLGYCYRKAVCLGK